MMFCFGALFLLFMTSIQGADLSNVALLLRNIATLEDKDINMIGKFQQPLEKTVIIIHTGKNQLM